jgi:acetamidase/formamidase
MLKPMLKFKVVLFFLLINPALKAQHTKHIFQPKIFYNGFSLRPASVLNIQPGDTVQTETIDALGFDKDGVRRGKGGNPLTGPFTIEGAMPGDVLVIHLQDVSLNRGYAYTSESFVSRSMPKDVMENFKKSHLVKWTFNENRTHAKIDSSFHEYPHLQQFDVELAPFLGCIGVAPKNKKNEILSFFQGPYGGNLDFSMVKSGSTIYLPVFHEGAKLYIGDGHAVQGDGEIAGNALETSMNVTFSVEIIKRDSLSLNFPRVEDAVYIMATGIAKEIPEALKLATKNMLDWLQKNYRLTLYEATQVMSTSIEYTIAEIADPNVVMVAKIRKEVLKKIN